MRKPRTIVWVTLGVLTGFLGAHGIFAALLGELQGSDTDVSGRAERPRAMPPSPMRATVGAPAITASPKRTTAPPPALSEEEAEPEAIEIDWTRARANLPLDYLEDLAMGAFTSENQSPWDPEAEAFVISPDLNRILQLDDGQSEAVRNILLESRQNETARRWAAPASLKATENGVMIEIAPAGEDVETSLRASLIPIMGERRTGFFMQKIKPTLDWEYGAFGSLRRLVEVSVLPDDTLSIRESLHGAEGGGASWFEVQTRQYRVDHLPASIAALVNIEE